VRSFLAILLLLILVPVTAMHEMGRGADAERLKAIRDNIKAYEPKPLEAGSRDE
jgi:hypothetical protein